MTERNNWNEQIIKEFRTNDGKVGGPFQGATLLLLTSKGAKSGKPYTTPLAYLPDGDRYVVFASKGGAPTNPDWYYNLKANPEVTIEVGTDVVDVVATEVTGAERDSLYAAQAARMDNFREYAESAAPRVIPVIRLTRR